MAKPRMMANAMLMMENDNADVNDDDDTDGGHVLHRCPAGARHSVEQLPKRETAVACGRRAGAHLPSPMAEGLGRAKDGRRGLERKRAQRDGPRVPAHRRRAEASPGVCGEVIRGYGLCVLVFRVDGNWLWAAYCNTRLGNLLVTLLGGLARPWRQHAAGGANGEHRSWGMLWTTPSKWLVCSGLPLSEDVLSSAV